MSVHHSYGDDVLFTCSLPGSANPDTRCNLYFGEASRPVLTTDISGKKTSKKQSFCQFTVKIDDLLSHLRLVQQSDASCDYSLGSEPNPLSPRSDGYSLTDIVERESSMTPTMPTFSMTKGLTVSRRGVSTLVTPVKRMSDLTDSSPGASTTPVKPAMEVTQTMQSSTMTTGLTVSRSGASTPVTPAKPASGHLTVGSSNTDSCISTSLTPEEPAPETWTWKSVVVAACFGGVVLLGLALLWTKKRTERGSEKRTQDNVTDDLMCMRNLDHGGLLTAGNDEAYSVITSVPAADCPTGCEKLNRQAPQNKDSDIYHVYTIPEEPPPSALKNMVYSTLQAH
ncbi:uncharacterized protein LOC120556839 [Perca fluviatilis]|uniref:uncharacterized protein LOC120556839 n=1 Tax=Perca fluviatilis TaxID=8168 RepID=UPI00196301CE|nr:uncharacterized protein LOC120556839 [Perca fluviatilis]